MLGSGTEGDPYRIEIVDHLQEIENDLAAYYIVVKDIDAAETSTWNAGAGFLPIGRNVPWFTGHLDGQGYKVTDLWISRAAENYTGLFATTVNPATITNLELVTPTVVGARYVGNLGGYVYGGSNCKASGSVSGDEYVGGLVGITGAGNWADCNSSAIITVGNFAGWSFGGGLFGGLLGAAAGGSASRCYATGSVTATGMFVGGFTGVINRLYTIDQCFAIGAVSGDDYIGGFVGQNLSSDINNCFARGSVTGDDLVGGFCGEHTDWAPLPAGTIDKCYSTGLVTGNTNVGGLVGANDGVVSDSYWDTVTSGQAASAGGTGKTTKQMKQQVTFTDWDFETIWKLISSCNAGYPCLSGVTPLCILISDSLAPLNLVTLEVLRNIEMAARGRLYIDEEGKFKYESRFKRN